MSEQRMKRWMDAIDEEWLEEAQRPQPRFSAARRWGALAACFGAAVLTLALWQPWNAQMADTAAVYNTRAAGKASAADAADDGTVMLAETLALPSGGVLLSDYDLRHDESGAVAAASCTVEVNGYSYDYGAAYTSEPLPSPGGELPTASWEVSGLTVLVYENGAVSWYNEDTGIQWYCATSVDGAETLVTAFELMGAQSYTVPVAPEGAEVLGYDLFELDGMTVTEVTFAENGRTWHYRMASTADVTETIPDISEYSGGSLSAEGKVRWCQTALRWDEGGAGCVIWKDIVPGFTYSLTVDSGAAELLLDDMTGRIFKPAQGDS